MDTKKGARGMKRLDKWMREAHLYAGLVLAPWLLVYATSAFCLNRGPRLVEWLGIPPPSWSTVRSAEFVPPEEFPTDPALQAQSLLQYLDLDGAHRILGKPTADKMVIFRISGGGHYRITWHRPDSQVLVEKQPFSLYRLLHFLHFRHGYGQPHAAHILWAVLVDTITLCLWVWVVSGIYIALRRPRLA